MSLSNATLRGLASPLRSGRALRDGRVLLVAACAALATPSAAAPLCKPVIAVKQTRLSAMRPPTMERTWTATVSADASACATESGGFALLIARQMENGPEADFTERFRWTPGLFEVSVTFWADESVEAYWLGAIDACPCK